MTRKESSVSDVFDGCALGAGGRSGQALPMVSLSEGTSSNHPLSLTLLLACMQAHELGSVHQMSALFVLSFRS